MPITNHFHLPTGHVDGASLPNDVLKDFDIPSDANIEPDLNELQLMILALLSSPARKLDLCAITQWITTHIPFWAQHHKNCAVDPITDSDFSLSRKPCVCEAMFAREVQKLDAPFRFDAQGGQTLSLLVDEYLPKLFPSPIQGQTAQSVTAPPTTEPTATWIRAAAPTFTCYHRLPDEVRRMIQVMALTFDQPKPMIEFGRYRFSWYQTTYYLQSEVRKHLHIVINGRGIRLEKPDRLMSLFLVNKEFHRFCVPLFFRHYTFVFTDALHMRQFLKGIGANRRQLVQNVSLELMKVGNHGIDRDNACSAFRLLADTTRLRTFTLKMNRQNFSNIQTLKWGLDYAPSRIPGMTLLSKFRGVSQLNIEGDFPELRTFLADMTLPCKDRPGEKISNNSRLAENRLRREIRSINVPKDDPIYYQLVAKLEANHSKIQAQLAPTMWLPQQLVNQGQSHSHPPARPRARRNPALTAKASQESAVNHGHGSKNRKKKSRTTKKGTAARRKVKETSLDLADLS